MNDTVVDAAIEGARKQIDPQDGPALETFAQRLLRGVETHPIGGTPALVSMLAEGFAWIRQRKPGEIRVRLRNCPDRPGLTVLELHQDDRPFLLESVELILARFGVRQRLVVHPTLVVLRDAAGRMTGIEPGSNGEPRESYIYIEIAPPIEPPRLQALEDQVRQVMSWVADVTADHRRMIHAIRQLNADLEFAGPALGGGPERTARVQNFLQWIIEGRFVLIGMRRYRVSHVDDEMEAGIVPGSGLGMWRDDRSSRLAVPLRGAAIPPEIREDLEDPRIILISKSHMESRIHRAGRLDRVFVKEHDEQGAVVGFSIIVGLFTGRVLRTPGSQIPLLSERLRALADRLGLVHGSHAHQAIVTVFDSLPVELLVEADLDSLADLLPELVAAASSKTVRLVTRSHKRGRLLYAAILIPREHYREDLRVGIRRLLEEHTGARYIDDRTSFVEEGAAIVHCFCTSAEGETIHADFDRLEAEVRQLCSPWEDQIRDALRQHYGDDEALGLAARYELAFPEALHRATHVVDAVRDVKGLETLFATGEPQCALYFDCDDDERETATLRLYLTEQPLLSDILPVADHFGLQVVDAQLFEVAPTNLSEVYVESLRIVPLGADQDDLDALAPRLGDALRATLTGEVRSDALNRLVLLAGLDWRQVDLIRAYQEYLVQIQGTLSRPSLWKVLLENPLAVRILVHGFETRFDPRVDDGREQRLAEFERDFQSYRDRISALNEDRALYGFFNLIQATLRTNYFAPRSRPHRVVLKFDSSRVDGLSGVIPYREIFVHSAELTGIHLRGGPVARGGLRWSDRNDDLRVEILDLMSTQMLKNGIIVPVGAKGGFVLHRDGLSPSEARATADHQYCVFISSLLDVTDNLSPEGEVLPPEGVRRLDGDDPYLVVAADKGTAHLSDTANEIARTRDFWLDDAFASGGSDGYDHKKYGITARGAWECVKHHLAELGVDPEGQTYEVVGIGDMSGDVFGNGLLLMRHAKLLAAFDHRHVFLDPEPDPDASWAERKRLFEMERSTWEDYEHAALSPGGGVWQRGSKRIPIPPLLRERLGLGDEASGQEVVAAILAMDVDIFWNGGIGTYVKASHESHAEVGDRVNDAVRIDATRLRARIVGEGGNLGLTQAARVEAAMAGVRLDSDAIHNSAGVDLSDHEVNFKIALAPLVRSGRLDVEARRRLLVDVANGACESVLSHNRGQALAISLDEIRSRRDPDTYASAIAALCEHAGLAPSELELPDAEALRARSTAGLGLTRPELGVILGLAKLHGRSALLEADFAEARDLYPLYLSYFPARFRDELSDGLDSHPLRREITSLCVVNRLIDAGGAALFSSLHDEIGADAATAAAAMLVAEEVLGVPLARARIIAESTGSRSDACDALVELDEGVRMVAHFLVKTGLGGLDADRIERWRSDLDQLFAALHGFLLPVELQHLGERRDRLLEQGLPKLLADRLASLPLADRGLNILRVVEATDAPIVETAHLYTRLSEEAGFGWMYERLGFSRRGSLWDRMVVIDLRQGLLDLHRTITEWVLTRRPADSNAALDAFLADRAADIGQIQDLQQRITAADTPSALSVIASRLHGLRPSDPRPES